MAHDWRIKRLRKTAEHTEEYKGFTILINHEPDGFGCNPRDNDGNAHMITWDRRDYNSPDENWGCWGEYDQGGAFDFLDWLKERKQQRHSKDHGVVYAYLDRNGYDGTLDLCNDPDEDDARAMHRTDGVIYATYEDIREWQGKRGITPALIEQTRKGFAGELQEYNDWATGNIYGYVVTDDSDEEHDGCTGYIGDYDASYGALSEARAYVDRITERGYLPAISDKDAEQDAAEEIAEYAAHFANVAA